MPSFFKTGEWLNFQRPDLLDSKMVLSPPQYTEAIDFTKFLDVHCVKYECLEKKGTHG